MQTIKTAGGQRALKRHTVGVLDFHKCKNTGPERRIYRVRKNSPVGATSCRGRMYVWTHWIFCWKAAVRRVGNSLFKAARWITRSVEHTSKELHLLCVCYGKKFVFKELLVLPENSSCFFCFFLIIAFQLAKIWAIYYFGSFVHPMIKRYLLLEAESNLNVD